MFFFFNLFLTYSLQCNDSPAHSMICDPVDCVLDSVITINCTVFHSTQCDGARIFLKNVSCRYCYQLNAQNISCDVVSSCIPGISQYSSRCKPLIPCMGNSIFEKRDVCRSYSKSQKTAFLLSLFLGGLGIDRFYLGYTYIALLKIFTLGGLGVLYMADLFLILFGYLGPADKGLYFERI